MRGWTRLGMLAAALAWGLGVSGCSLPAITAEFPVAENQSLPGTVLPLPLFGVPLVPAATCNLPDEQDFEQAVRERVGAFLARLIRIDAAVLRTVTLAVREGSAGDFSSLTKVEVQLHLLDAGGGTLETIGLGTAESATGFGRRMTLEVEPPVDLIPLLRTSADCGAVSVAVSGQSPAAEVRFDAGVRLTIRAGLGGK